MNKKITKYIYIGLFAALYLSVALVSGIHAVQFFSLANTPILGVMLAITFEIGQAAVLFSLLTNPNQRKKVMTWVQLSIFTLVQILGNVYSSYKYIVTNSIENLRYFREPVFVWTDLPDQTCNVIITYLVGGILPISALLLTEMLTNYLYGNDNKKEVENEQVTKKNVLNKENEGTKKEEVSTIQEITSSNLPEQQIKENTKQDTRPIENDNVNQTINNEEVSDEQDKAIEENEETDEDVIDKEDDGIIEEDEESNTRLQEDVNRTDETDNEAIDEGKKVTRSKPHFLNLN